jgi:hypothetical protein
MQYRENKKLWARGAAFAGGTLEVSGATMFHVLTRSLGRVMTGFTFLGPTRLSAASERGSSTPLTLARAAGAPLAQRAQQDVGAALGDLDRPRVHLLETEGK